MYCTIQDRKVESSFTVGLSAKTGSKHWEKSLRYVVAYGSCRVSRCDQHGKDQCLIWTWPNGNGSSASGGRCLVMLVYKVLICCHPLLTRDRSGLADVWSSNSAYIWTNQPRVWYRPLHTSTYLCMYIGSICSRGATQGTEPPEVLDRKGISQEYF